MKLRKKEEKDFFSGPQKSIGFLRKIGVFVFLILLSFIVVSGAQNDTDDKAYSCLEDKLGDNCGNSNSVEQISLSLIAMAYNSGIQQDCKDLLLDKQSGKSFGNIKETSLATIALDYIGTNTDDEEENLISRKKSSDLDWYIEIDSEEKTQCSVTGGGSITVDENKKVSGSTGNCFSLAYNNYWLKIDDSCMGRNLTTSCDKNFLSAVIYKKTNSNIWHISSDVQAASPGGQTEHYVNSYCFSDSNSCDYESSLWAVLALSATKNDISDYLPYLITNSKEEENKKYFPEAFLYILTDSEEYLNSILTKQQNSYWKLGNNEYYDTALALLAVSDTAPISNAESWLETKQGTDGCWNNGNIRDTSFLLWANWPRNPVRGGGGGVSNPCEPAYYCLNLGECEDTNVLNAYDCPPTKECCKVGAVEKSCEERKGKKCQSGYECDIQTVSTPNEPKCCIGECVSEVSECVEWGNKCRVECLSSEEETEQYECPSEDVCCKEKPEGPNYWRWIIILIVLIILVVLAIIFRDKLRNLIFKARTGFKKGPVTITRPSYPPAPPLMRRIIPGRMIIPKSQTTRTIRKPVTKTEKELEETMRKLREMSK